MTPLDALQKTLAAEHAAVYVLAVLGGRTSQSSAAELFAAISSAYDAHRARRDLLIGEIVGLGADPVASEPAYEVPEPIGTPSAVARAGLAVERSCAATYAFLVASTVGDRRRWAITALNETAVRELAFRGTPEMFPGAGEYADR